MKHLKIIILLLIIQINYAQKKIILNDSIILNNNIKEITQKITNFFVYQKEYNETIVSDDEDKKNTKELKSINFKKYLFWKSNGKCYVKKYDNYGEYKKIEIDNDQVLKFSEINFAIIKKEHILPYFIITNLNGKRILEQVIHPITTYSTLYLKVNKQSSLIKFDDFFITNERIVDKKNENVNFTRNNNLKTIQLKKICEKEINEIEKENNFILIE